MLNTSLDTADDAGNREHQGFPVILPEAHTLQGMGVLIEGVTRASDSSHRSVHAGRDIRVKVNLHIFKDEKSKMP